MSHRELHHGDSLVLSASGQQVRGTEIIDVRLIRSDRPVRDERSELVVCVIVGSTLAVLSDGRITCKRAGTACQRSRRLIGIVSIVVILRRVSHVRLRFPVTLGIKRELHVIGYQRRAVQAIDTNLITSLESLLHRTGRSSVGRASERLIRACSHLDREFLHVLRRARGLSIKLVSRTRAKRDGYHDGKQKP